MPAEGFCDPEKERYWRQVFNKFEKSNLSGMEFCRREQLRYSLFSDWRQRIRKRDAKGLKAIELSDEQWIQIIEATRADSRGVRTHLEERGINPKSFYKRFQRLRKERPDWVSLYGQGGGRRKGSKNKKPRQMAEFVRVEVASADSKVKNQAAAEIVLPSGLIVRMNSACTVEFISSLAAALGGK